MARAFDVYSVNIYDFEVQPDRVKKIAELTGKPVIGEFHFGTPGGGLAASLVQSARRSVGRHNRYYVENAFAMPELIGTHWFQWTGNSTLHRAPRRRELQYRLVDVTDRPMPIWL